MKSNTIKLQKKCDSLLTPIVRKKTPCCEACGMPTQVAHHWVEKSRCSLLRYDFRNLIALCQSCHTKIHNLFGNSITGSLNVAEKIIKKRGKAWKVEMERLSHQLQKVNVAYYQEVLKKLQNEIN